MKTKTSLTTLISVAVLALGLSIGAYAAEANNHTAETGKKMDMPMKAKMATMQAEMQTIIDTEDTAKRKELFEAHKAKMQGMMGMMQKMHSDCHGKHEMKDKEGAEHTHKNGEAHEHTK